MIRDRLINDCIGSRCPRHLKEREPENESSEGRSRRKHQPRRGILSSGFGLASQGGTHVLAQMCGRAICRRVVGECRAQFANGSFTGMAIGAALQVPFRCARVRQIEFAVDVSVE